MGKLEEESSSGLDEPDAGQIWNIMHAFWLRFIVAGGTTSVWWIVCVKMSTYGITMNELWGASMFIALSVIAWIGVGKQLYMDCIYSGVFNSSNDDHTMRKDLPW